jgi:hypothetical protein
MQQTFYDMRSEQKLVEFEDERKRKAVILSLESPRGNEWSPSGVSQEEQRLKFEAVPRFPLYKEDDNKTEEYQPQLLALCLVAEYQTIGSKPFLSLTAVNKALHSAAQFDGIWRNRMEEFEETVGFRGLFNQFGIGIKSIVPPRWSSDQKRKMRNTSLPWEHWALEDPWGMKIGRKF